jgi:hypothetical protein
MSRSGSLGARVGEEARKLLFIPESLAEKFRARPSYPTLLGAP